MNILITGGTGFLGSELVEVLSHQFETVYVLSRKINNEQFSHLENVKFIKGDVTNLDVINLKELNRDHFLNSIDIVLHAAALYDLSASYSASFLQNVVGTQNVIHLLGSMKKLKAFYYISTIAVGDPKTYFLEEDSLPARINFSDSYSETKFLAEQIVRSTTTDRYVTRIIRPGIIVGNSINGVMPKIDGPYYFINAFKNYGKTLMRRFR